MIIKNTLVDPYPIDTLKHRVINRLLLVSIGRKQDFVKTSSALYHRPSGRWYGAGRSLCPTYLIISTSPPVSHKKA